MLDPVGRGFLVICAALWWWQVMAGSLPPPCDSRIYCTGELLQQVQLARLFQDNKDFVDMLLKSNPEAQRGLWPELQSAAESGWDFSSRWFLPGSPPLQDSLQGTRVTGVVPVDLNAILCKVEQPLATFYQVLGDGEKASWFWAARRQRVAAVTAVLWNEDGGVLVHNRAFYPSNLSPLWTECGMDLPRTEKALHYLEESSALSYTNRLPTSLTQMGQQWDLPNAWAPVQHMVVLGLAKSSSPRARELAFSLAQRWLQMNLAVFEKYGGMFEKISMMSKVMGSQVVVGSIQCRKGLAGRMGWPCNC